MSSTLKDKVPEAELVAQVDTDNFNPFATPTIIEGPAEITDGIGRATPKEISFACRSLVAAELSYVALCISFIVSFVWFGDFTFWIWAATSLAAWICFIAMVKSCNEKGDLIAFLSILAFPIPVLGFFIFFATKMQVDRFLIWNGYCPGFLGATPDLAEVSLMNSNPIYRPSAWYRHDGSKRSMVWSLSDSFVAIMVLFAFVSVLIQL